MVGEQYVPTTEDIREYVIEGGEPRPWVPTDDVEENARAAKRAAAFDCWLNKLLADTWHEGFGVGERSGAREMPLSPWTENPYGKPHP